jgi:hypothetical protein
VFGQIDHIGIAVESIDELIAPIEVLDREDIDRIALRYGSRHAEIGT